MGLANCLWHASIGFWVQRYRVKRENGTQFFYRLLLLIVRLSLDWIKLLSKAHFWQNSQFFQITLYSYAIQIRNQVRRVVVLTPQNRTTSRQRANAQKYMKINAVKVVLPGLAQFFLRFSDLFKANQRGVYQHPWSLLFANKSFRRGCCWRQPKFSIAF